LRERERERERDGEREREREKKYRKRLEKLRCWLRSEQAVDRCRWSLSFFCVGSVTDRRWLAAG
jgi:hypothetical protein